MLREVEADAVGQTYDIRAYQSGKLQGPRFELAQDDHSGRITRKVFVGIDEVLLEFIEKSHVGASTGVPQ